MHQTALIVNPCPEQRQTLQSFLSSADYKVLTANSGDEALEVCSHYKAAIHLLVTDVELPGTSGWEVAEIASKAQPGIIVLFLSGAASSSDARASFNGAGTFHELFSSSMLIDVMQALSRKSRRKKLVN